MENSQFENDLAKLKKRQARKKESYNERYLVAQCKEHGIMCRKLETPGVTGAPDRMLIRDGRVVLVELKRDMQSKLRATQIAEIKKYREAGAFVAVCKSEADIDAITGFLRGLPRTGVLLSEVLHREI